MKHSRESILALIDECRKNGTRIDLINEDLSGLDLSDLDLRLAKLQLANLQETNLQRTDLFGAELQWADLRGANLRGANLQGANQQKADLRGANLDYCGFELSQNTIGIKADKRLVGQLLYHLCKMDVQDCPEWTELRNNPLIIALAAQRHFAGSYEEILVDDEDEEWLDEAEEPPLKTS